MTTAEVAALRLARRRMLVGGMLGMTAMAGVLVRRPLGPPPADEVPSLEALVPVGFDDWRTEPGLQAIEVSPTVQAELDRVYDRTVTRTYMDRRGRALMLSVAYGREQSRALQVHRPEVCYTAQGFSVAASRRDSLAAAGRRLSVTRLVAVRGPRHEPITYWLRVGDEVIADARSQALARLRHAWRGEHADGIVVRVSSLGADPERQFPLHDAFVVGLAANLPAAAVPLLFGPVADALRRVPPGAA